VKRLLIITDLYPDSNNPIGGIFVQHQVIELAKYYQICVYATYLGSVDHIEEGIDQGFRIVRNYSAYHQKVYLSSVLSYKKKVLPHLQQTILAFSPDFIHVHDCRHVPELINLAPMLASLAIPKYLTLHNISTHPSKIKNSFSAFVYRGYMATSLKGWDHVFTVNKSLQEIVSAYTTSKQVSVIGNAISEPAEEFDTCMIDRVSSFSAQAELRIISAGNLLKTKGFDLLISAVNKLVRMGVDAVLVIAGAGNMRPFLEKQIIELDLQKRVNLLGSVANGTLRRLYPLFDVFVLPSFSETFGIVYLEAMDAGIPTVGVKGQGIDSIIINGANGWLVEPKSIESIVDTLLAIHSHPEQSKAIAKRGKITVETHHRLTNLCNRLRSVYENR